MSNVRVQASFVGTAAQFTTANRVLLVGEMGYESDTKKIKYGDGVTAWNSLPYYFDDTKASLGLDQVDNTSDLDKPISNDTQDALDLKADLTDVITQLTGEVTAGPGGGSAAATVSNAAVIAKVLTGLAETYGRVISTDSILQAIAKLAWSQGLHSNSISQNFTIPDNYTLIRSGIVLEGSAELVIGSGSTLQLI